MKISELLAAYGDDNVQLQNLDQCADTLNMNRGTTRITFGTEQPLTPTGMEKLGLVIWLDRDRVKEITASAPTAPGREEATDLVKRLREKANDIDSSGGDWNARLFGEAADALSPSSAHPAQGLVERVSDILSRATMVGSAEVKDQLIEQAITALRGKDDGWFRIDDPENPAPKDASRILIHVPASSRPVQEVWWALEYEGGPGFWMTPMGPTGRGYTILPEAPTHWQPLPAPPSTPSREG